MSKRTYTIEIEETETLIPLSVLVTRLEKHRDRLIMVRASLPWYALKKRIMMTAGINAYEYELECVLKLGGSTNMARLGISSITKTTKR